MQIARLQVRATFNGKTRMMIPQTQTAAQERQFAFNSIFEPES
jgi:hypothetical protein